MSRRELNSGASNSGAGPMTYLYAKVRLCAMLLSNSDRNFLAAIEKTCRKWEPKTQRHIASIWRVDLISIDGRGPTWQMRLSYSVKPWVGMAIMLQPTRDWQTLPRYRDIWEMFPTAVSSIPPDLQHRKHSSLIANSQNLILLWLCSTTYISGIFARPKMSFVRRWHLTPILRMLT